jgi:hypothetical protein
VSGFEAKTMKDQLNNDKDFLFSLDGILLKWDAEWLKIFDTETGNAINRI